MSHASVGGRATAADDRVYAYGAPITRLALTSNALHMAVMDPACDCNGYKQRHVNRAAISPL